MMRYLVCARFTMIVDSDEFVETIASNCVARIEEGAQSSEHLLDYEVMPFPLPESTGELLD